MLKLGARERDPYWLDVLPGVRIKVRPITVAAIVGARQAAADAMKGEREGHEVFVGGVAFTRSIARWGIVEWEGVGDAKGAPAAPTPDNIDALLEHWQAFDAIDRLYVSPALILAEEKNGSSPSQNGTSAGAKPTARRARKRAPAVHT